MQSLRKITWPRVSPVQSVLHFLVSSWQWAVVVDWSCYERRWSQKHWPQTNEPVQLPRCYLLWEGFRLAFVTNMEVDNDALFFLWSPCWNTDIFEQVGHDPSECRLPSWVAGWANGKHAAEQGLTWCAHAEDRFIQSNVVQKFEHVYILMIIG